MYFSDELYTDWGKKANAVKEYDTDQYTQYLDTVKQKSKEIHDRFVAENRPDAESEKWAQLFGEESYYQYLAWYASEHRIANKMGWDNDWDVPKGFYDSLLNRLPIEPSMFISAYALSSFSNKFIREIRGTWL